MAEQSVVVDGESGHALGGIARLMASPWSWASSSVSSADRLMGRCTTPAHVRAGRRAAQPPSKARADVHGALVWGPGDANGMRAVDVRHASRARRGTRVLGALDAARASGTARLRRGHSRRGVADGEGNVQVASRHYAFEGRCYVLAAGSLMRASALPSELGATPAIVYVATQFVLRGGSAIIAPDGRYMCAKSRCSKARRSRRRPRSGPNERGIDDARCHRPL